MRKIQSLSLEEASTMVETVIKACKEDGGDPVAVAVVGNDGRLIAFAAMDNVLPGSIQLSQNKAYTAVALRTDTIVHHQTQPPKNPGNYGDPRITMMAGGVLVDHGGMIYGGIGISGRKALRKEGDDDPRLNDHELASHGRDVLVGSFAGFPL